MSFCLDVLEAMQLRTKAKRVELQNAMQGSAE